MDKLVLMVVKSKMLVNPQKRMMQQQKIMWIVI